MFTWDTKKALSNYEKHRVSFEEAATVFADEVALDWEDYYSLFTRSGALKMAKKQSALSAPGRQAAKSAKSMRDKDIDFSDIPESTDKELHRARRVGRPATGKAKQLIAIRISPEVLQKLKKLAAKSDKPYQTLINDLLESATKKIA
jgi:uncharacterized protein (DUF4415 family)